MNCLLNTLLTTWSCVTNAAHVSLCTGISEALYQRILTFLNKKSTRRSTIYIVTQLSYPPIHIHIVETKLSWSLTYFCLKCTFTFCAFLSSISFRYITWFDVCIYCEPQICNDTTLTTESKEELKSLLMKVKEESEKPGLKLNIQKMKIMASSPFTSWQVDGEIMIDFVFLSSKITVDGDCSHEIKRCWLLGRKAMTNLDSVF